MAIETEVELIQEPIVRHYRGSTRAEVEQAYRTEAAKAAQAGYLPVVQQWAADWHGFLLAVTYRASPAGSAPAPMPVQEKPAMSGAPTQGPAQQVQHVQPPPYEAPVSAQSADTPGGTGAGLPSAQPPVDEFAPAQGRADQELYARFALRDQLSATGGFGGSYAHPTDLQAADRYAPGPEPSPDRYAPSPATYALPSPEPGTVQSTYETPPVQFSAPAQPEPYTELVEHEQFAAPLPPERFAAPETPDQFATPLPPEQFAAPETLDQFAAPLPPEQFAAPLPPEQNTSVAEADTLKSAYALPPEHYGASGPDMMQANDSPLVEPDPIRSAYAAQPAYSPPERQSPPPVEEPWYVVSAPVEAPVVPEPEPVAPEQRMAEPEAPSPEAPPAPAPAPAVEQRMAPPQPAPVQPAPPLLRGAAPASAIAPAVERAEVAPPPPLREPQRAHAPVGRQARLTIQTMDLHSAGEPLRIVRSGFPDVPSVPVLERRRWVMEHADHVRRAIISEPRGHRDMYGAILLPPYSDYADMTVLFIHNEGYSTMCGHGIIAITTGLIEEGLYPATEPVTTIRYEVPAGIVAANAATVQLDDGNWAVQGVRFTNVPSYVAAQSLQIRPDGVALHGNASQYGALNVDLAFGGAYYGIVNAAELGMRVVPDQAEDLRRAGAAITEVLRRDHTPSHPTDSALSFVYGTIIVDLDPRSSPDGLAKNAHMRNATIFADAELDRSPCGSGTSAILAQLHARGRIKVGQEIINAGITGEHFLGRIEAETALGPYAAVSTSIAGTAYLTGYSTFVVDSRDPLGEGFLLR